ncbi:hypothetical protein BJ165DRAFT_1524079 [Panaeolus papilionaceus]|nr:hypothetical protein BJ165DRAFT_1524079 [Panaeolus papilionaceus]
MIPEPQLHTNIESYLFLNFPSTHSTMVKLISIATLVAVATTANAFTLFAWDGNKFTGNQKKFSTSGSHKLGFEAKSYKWERGILDAGCCINFCHGSKSTGGFCDSHSNSAVASANRFDKVVLGCGSAILNC